MQGKCVVLMKKKLIAAALCLSTLTTACKDEKAAPAPQQEQPTQATPPQAKEVSAPSEAEVRAQLLPALASFPAVKLSEVKMDATPAETEGEVVVVARVKTLVEENLYTKEDAPEMLNEERKAANEAMNKAMMPELHYLLLVGAPAEIITEEDRRVKPLPDDLKKAADELKKAAESPVYHLHTPQGTAMEIPATMKARRNGSHWVISDLSFDTAPLRSLVNTLPEGALPAHAAIVKDGLEEQLRQALREKVSAFNAAAQPYIQNREQEARKRALELQARREEEAQAAAEQAAAQAACRELWEKTAVDAFKAGTVFTGEWKRGNDFGKIALRVTQTQLFTDSLQFVGALYDPALPQAEINVVGRCEAPSTPQDAVTMIVHLYNGRYDPDVATAEVFDSKDGLLKLQLAEGGSISGEMTCEAWSESPEKAFALSLAPAPKPAPKPTRRK